MTQTVNRVELEPRKVRITGDTFGHVYTLVAQVTTVERSGNRLYGGAVHYVVRTWSGRERTATTVVDAATPWGADDKLFAGIGNRARARQRMYARARKAEAAQELATNRRMVKSAVMFARGTNNPMRVARMLDAAADNAQVPRQWVHAMYEAK